MALGAQKIFVTPLTGLRTSGTDPVDPLGIIRWEGNKAYKNCILKLAPTADVDAVVGDALGYTDYSAHEVGVDNNDFEADLPAGVTPVAIDMSADKGKHIWVQIKGPVPVIGAPKGSPSAGQMLDVGSTGKADTFFTLWISTNEFTPAGTMVAATEMVLDCPF